MNKSRAVTVMLGIYVVITCSMAATLPIFVFAAHIIGGGAIAALYMKSGILTTGAVGLLSLGVTSLLGGGAEIGAVIVFEVMAIGLAMGMCFKKGRSFNETMAFTITAFTAAVILCSLATTYAVYGNVSYQSIIEPYESMLKTDVGWLIESGMTAGEAGQMIEVYLDYMLKTLIGFIAIFGSIICFLTFLFTRRCAVRMLGADMSAYKGILKKFKLSRIGGIIFIIAFLSILFIPDGVLRMALINMLLMLIPAVIFNGISIGDFLMQKRGFSKLKRMLVFAVVFISMFTPFNLMFVIMSLGTFDAIANYRKLSV